MIPCVHVTWPTIRKDPDIDWMPLASTLSAEIIKFLNSGAMAVIEQNTDSIVPEVRSKIEREILEILDEEIRPAIAQDGGDLIFGRQFLCTRKSRAGKNIDEVC